MIPYVCLNALGNKSRCVYSTCFDEYETKVDGQKIKKAYRFLGSEAFRESVH